jgi:hypothetical protein
LIEREIGQALELVTEVGLGLFEAWLALGSDALE